MKFIKVEYINDKEENTTTYEIFRDIDRAYNFAKKNKVVGITLAEMNNTYKEQGEYNYEDFSNTIIEEVGV